jgi:two-component system, cell cycle response regulator
LKLLIAEDDLVLRFLLDELLRGWGHETVVAEDGHHALAAVARESFDGAILDWMMPGVTGLEVCRAIRDKGGERHPYVVMLTARTAQEDIVAGLDAGADEYITKPYSAIELAARLRAAERYMRVQDELLEAKRLIAFQAEHDIVTGALRRRVFMTNLHALLRARSRNPSPLSLVRVSLSGLSDLTEAYGTALADELLGTLAQRVRAQMPEGAELGRTDQNELLVLLPHADRRAAEAMAHRTAVDVHREDFPTSMGNIAVGVDLYAATASRISDFDVEALSEALDMARPIPWSRPEPMFGCSEVPAISDSVSPR